ncbi:MAG: S16 family serine protease [Bacillota bacterium]
MLQFIKQYKKLLIILLFPYLYTLFVLVAPTEQAVTAPGGLSQVVEAITIDGYEMIENFNTIYVYSYYPITPFQSWVLAADKTMTVYPMTPREKDLSWQDGYLQGQVSKYVSLKTSIIQAYKLAETSKPEMNIQYHYEGLYVYYRPSRINELEIGDQIVAINGNNYSDFTHDAFLTMASESEVEFTIRRVDDEDISYHTVSYTYQEDDPYMIFYPNYVIDSAYPSFEFPGQDSIIGGPSGGMIQTLSIYVSLVNINIGDLKIAGTGTIEMSGMVGRIGGITQKMYTAIYNDVDIMIIPESHFIEIPSINYPFEIVTVQTVEQAVEWLNERFN